MKAAVLALILATLASCTSTRVFLYRTLPDMLDPPPVEAAE